MANTEDTVELSEIKGKPVDAIGHMLFHINFDHFKSPFHIEKIFGLVDVKTDAIFKFKLVVSEDGSRRIKFKFIYISEESIDCKIKIDNCPSVSMEHLTIGDELKTFSSTKEGLKSAPVYFGISVLVITTTLKTNAFARKFNDPTNSDFIVKCQDKQFYVHQSILQERSEYFEAILRNDCIEKRDKMLQIDDFNSSVVEIFLRHLYNGAFPCSVSLRREMLTLMKLADKYNANELFDSIDSYLSQEFVFWFDLLEVPKRQLLIQQYLKEFKEIQTPKFITMFYKLRSTENGISCLNDKEWSSLIQKNPNLAMIGGITVGRTDYQSWVQQHISWSLTCETSEGRNDFAVLVGPIGEMKGAVKCSLFLKE